MKRGDVVRVAVGKSRPAVIVQADGMPTPVDVLLCPFTTTMLDVPFYRLSVRPSPGNGLAAESQIMVDKIGPARRDRIDGVIGRLSDTDIDRLGSALALMLDRAT